MDLGAGRAVWFEDDTCSSRNNIRLHKGKVKSVIASDIDKAVLTYRASDYRVMGESLDDLGLTPESLDLIVSDYVPEHIGYARVFAQSVQKYLKPGGWFCARTQHQYSYVALGARLVKTRPTQR